MTISVIAYFAPHAKKNNDHYPANLRNSHVNFVNRHGKCRKISIEDEMKKKKMKHTPFRQKKNDTRKKMLLYFLHNSFISMMMTNSFSVCVVDVIVVVADGLD